jgi:hypothetical protein
MKLSLRKWTSKLIPAMSWGAGFVLVLSALSAPAFADRAPEMDPSLATGAMALLSSGLLLIAGRRRLSK